MAAERSGTQVRLDEHSRRLDRHEAEHGLLWDAINNVRNRPPIWATFLISLLFTAVGVCVTLLAN